MPTAPPPMFGMTDTMFVALLASIPPTIAALTASIIALVGLRRSANTAKLSAIAAAKTDVLLNKTDEIHALTNSNLSKVTAALDVANTKIEGMRALMSSHTEAIDAAKDARALVAQALATTPVEPPPHIRRKDDPITPDAPLPTPQVPK